MSDRATGEIAALRTRLKRAGTAARARGSKAYLESDLVFFGTSVPDIRAIAAEYARGHPELDRRALRALATAAYATNEHEIRSVAIALLARERACLDDRDLPWLIRLVDQSDTWAHVDWLAVAVVGDVVARHPESLRRLPAWARHRNFWVRRTAILAQHDQLKRGRGDWRLFTRIAGARLHEKEFFVRKAIGWVLRETSKKRPALVYAFLRGHRGEVSGLTLREGAKHLTDTQRRALGLPPWRERESS